MFARRIFCWSTCDVFSFCLCLVLIVTVISITRDQGRQQHYQMMLRVSLWNWPCSAERIILQFDDIMFMHLVTFGSDKVLTDYVDC